MKRKYKKYTFPQLGARAKAFIFANCTILTIGEIADRLNIQRTEIERFFDAHKLLGTVPSRT